MKLGDEHMAIIILYSLLLFMSDFFHDQKQTGLLSDWLASTVLAEEERISFLFFCIYIKMYWLSKDQSLLFFIFQLLLTFNVILSKFQMWSIA